MLLNIKLKRIFFVLKIIKLEKKYNYKNVVLLQTSDYVRTIFSKKLKLKDNERRITVKWISLYIC